MQKAKVTIQARLRVKGKEKEMLLEERIPENYRLLIESPQRESGRAEGLTNGRNPSAPKFPRGTSYNLWRVLRAAVLTALSPERLPRDLSPLKRLVVSGDVGRIPLRGRETLLPGAGSMAGEIAPAGFIPSLNRRFTSSPAPELCNFAQFG